MDDLISRKAAYTTLTDYYHHTTEIQHKALREALERVPSAQPEKRTEERTETHACDCISRQAAIDAVEFGITYAKAFNVNTGESKEVFKEGNDALKKAVERLKDLPPAQPEVLACGEGELSAQPEREKGKWIYGESEAGNDGYYCSKCGNFVPWKYDEYDIDFIKEFPFCNKCGADMREPEDIPMEYFESGGK